MLDSTSRLYGSSRQEFDLSAAARREMIHQGFQPDFSADADEQIAAIAKQEMPARLRDLRGLLWSSIDNDSSRDLDQIEFAEKVTAGTRVLVGIADVDASVPRGSPIDL